MEELFRIELYYRKRPFYLVMSSEKKLYGVNIRMFFGFCLLQSPIRSGRKAKRDEESISRVERNPVGGDQYGMGAALIMHS